MCNSANSNPNYHNPQQHVHEITGSTATVNGCRECHNHRFCTVSGEAIRMGNSHSVLIFLMDTSMNFAEHHPLRLMSAMESMFILQKHLLICLTDTDISFRWHL